ncbi:MAG: SGNH/GDSL hydrolase family protein [Paraburkholderia fungorum]|nr:SGNH/GDSL hydrolase family protein [Paraburkholderia fungorum]
MNHAQITTVQASRVRRTSARATVVERSRATKRQGARWRAAAIAMTLGCALSACGGGGGGSNTPSVVAVPAVPTTPYVILVSGDSIDRGCSIPLNSTCSSTWAYDPALLLQADFNKHPEVGPVVVLERAVPGSTFDDIVNGTAPATETFATTLAALKPNMALSNSGVNDEYVGKQKPPQYASSQLAWVGVARAANVFPVVIEPTPICRSDADNALWTQFVQTEDATAAANAYPVLKLAAAWASDPNWCSDYIDTDFVHLTPAGDLFREAQIFPQLLALVKEQRGL